MRAPSASGSALAVVPGIEIRVWPFEASLSDARVRQVVTTALLDTGAAVSSIPLWSLKKMGIVPNEASKRTVFGTAGDFDAYSVRVRMEVEYDGGWVDIGAVDALVPDTPRSSDPDFHLPFLLGRSDFFSKFDMCVSESQKSVWLGRIGCTAAGGPRGATVTAQGLPAHGAAAAGSI